jgi:hypothetical protein
VILIYFKCKPFFIGSNANVAYIFGNSHFLIHFSVFATSVLGIGISPDGMSAGGFGATSLVGVRLKHVLLYSKSN